MQDVQVNTFSGGLDFDSDLRTIKSDRYVDALNVETLSIEKNGVNSITPMKSSALAFSVPDIIGTAQVTKLKYEAGVEGCATVMFCSAASVKKRSMRPEE